MLQVPSCCRLAGALLNKKIENGSPKNVHSCVPLTSSVKSRHGNYRKFVMKTKFGVSTLLSPFNESMKFRGQVTK